MKFKLSNLFATVHFGLLFGLLLVFIFWQYSTIREFHNIQLNNFFDQTNNVVNVLVENKKSEVKNIIQANIKEYSKSKQVKDLKDLDFIFSTQHGKIEKVFGYSLLFDIDKISKALKNIDDLKKLVKVTIDSKPFYLIVHKEQIVDEVFGKVQGELWGVIILNDNQSLINVIKTSAKIEELLFIDKTKDLVVSTLTKKDAQQYITNSIQNEIQVSTNDQFIYKQHNFFNDLNVIYLIDNSLYNNIYEKFISKMGVVIFFILLLGIILYYFIRFNFVQKLTELKYFIENNIKNKESKFKESKIEELDEIAFVFEKLFLDYKLEKERFDLATQSMKDGLWDWDPISNKVFFSSTWKMMLGYEENEIKGCYEDWKLRVHPDDIDKALFDLNSHLERSTALYENVHRIKHKDGRWLWMYARGKALFDENGKPYRVIGFNTDITLQKQVEKENLERDKVLFEQSKNAQMGEMIGNIAHQWRQPLSVISTAASGMKISKEYDLLTDEKMYEMVDKILKNTEFLSKTIDTFRDYIKEEKTYKEIVLQDRINNAINIIDASLTNNHIKLINKIDELEPVKMTLIVGELSQVIINILNNAKDVMIQNDVEEKWLKIELIRQDYKAIITIEDSGGGIKEDVLPKIFNPYFTTKHQFQGTGLGLHMSKEIVEKHLNGKLYAKNTQYGAKFFIELPIP
jgi:PAS domain S-box-containing protein